MYQKFKTFLGTPPAQIVTSLQNRQTIITYTDNSTVQINPSSGILTRNDLQNANSIKNIVIGNDITSIGDGALSNITSLTALTFLNDSQCSSIGLSACLNTRIRDLVLPDSMRRLEENSFNHVPLSAITYNVGLQYVGKDVFYDNRKGDYSVSHNGFREINIPSLSDWLLIEGYTATDESNSYRNNPLWFADPNGSKKGLLINSQQISGEVVIPNIINKLESCQFNNCDKITKIVFPPTIKYIPHYCFYAATSLSALDFSKHTSVVTFDSGHSPFQGFNRNVTVTVRNEEMKQKFEAAWGTSMFTFVVAS